MAVNTIGAVSNLPAGAVARIGGGVASRGYASLRGVYPAGTYLIKTNYPATVRMGENTDVPTFSGANKFGNDIVLRTTQTSYNIDYLSHAFGTQVTSATWQQQANALGNIPGGTVGQAVIASAQTDAFVMPYTRYYNPFSTTFSASCFTFQGVSYATSSTTFYSSTDGISGWATSGGASSAANRSESQYATNGQIVVCVTNSTTLYYTTNVASGFSAATLPNAADKVVYGNGIFLALNDSSTASSYSYDGINWTAFTAPAAGVYGNKIAFGNGVFVMTGNTGAFAYYSTNGLTWTSVAAYTGNGIGLGKIAFANGIFLVMPDETGAVTSSIANYGTAWSTNGINWYQGATLPNSTWSTSTRNNWSVYNIGTGFIFGQSNQYSFTADGITSLPVQGTNFNTYIGGFGAGTRGLLMDGGKNIYNLKMPNAYFDIYQLDSTYQTYNN